MLLATGVSCARQAPIDVHDGFETSHLSELWERSRFEPGAVTMQSGVVRAGHGAARIVIHPGDTFEAGTRSADSERDELLEASRLVSKEDVGYEYSFSMFIPPDFPSVRTRLILAQWKQDCNGAAACSDDAPVVALRYVSGMLAITKTIGPQRDTLFRTDENLRGRWTDFRFRLRFSTSDHGSIRAWLDGRPVLDYSGVTAYQENAGTGYESPGRFYFKMGLYRDLMPVPMTLYIDEYRKKQLPDGDAAGQRAGANSPLLP
jgi:hypothetical protein